MTKLKLSTCALALAAVAMTLPADAWAARHHTHHRTCGARRRAHANNGTLIGGASGGVIGGAITHGSAVGIIGGAAAGAVAGHQVGKGTVRC